MINAKGCGERKNLPIGLYVYPSKRNYYVFRLFSTSLTFFIYSRTQKLILSLTNTRNQGMAILPKKICVTNLGMRVFCILLQQVNTQTIKFLKTSFFLSIIIPLVLDQTKLGKNRRKKKSENIDFRFQFVLIVSP